MAITTRCVFTTVRKANRSLFRYYQDALADADISIVQLAILRALEQRSPMSFPELADELVMERTSLYRTIKPLVSLTAIEVSTSETGRTKHAKLTNYGQSLIEQTMPYWEKAQNSILEKLGTSQWEDISNLLLDLPAVISNVRK